MRKVVVTGAASGIGRAVHDLLASEGNQVFGVDRAASTVSADLSTPSGRETMVRAVAERAGGRIDAVVACAGLAWGDPAVIAAVNFFGAVATAQLFHSMLGASPAPRVLVVSSEAILLPTDKQTIDACLANDEAAARKAAGLAPENVYASTKTALSRWVKREAVTAKWAGSGILLNAVAPGPVATPMIQDLLDTAEGRARLNEMTPSALGRAAAARELAAFISFMISPENSYIVGQTIFCDGGAEAILRPEHL